MAAETPPGPVPMTAMSTGFMGIPPYMQLNYLQLDCTQSKRACQEVFLTAPWLFREKSHGSGGGPMASDVVYRERYSSFIWAAMVSRLNCRTFSLAAAPSCSRRAESEDTLRMA